MPRKCSGAGSGITDALKPLMTSFLAPRNYSNYYYYFIFPVYCVFSQCNFSFHFVNWKPHSRIKSLSKSINDTYLRSTLYWEQGHQYYLGRNLTYEELEINCNLEYRCHDPKYQINLFITLEQWACLWLHSKASDYHSGKLNLIFQGGQRSCKSISYPI